jgi:hypothetical protein
VTPFARIAQLHRELAEAFDELDQVSRPKPKLRQVRSQKPGPDSEKVRELRASLRRMGVKVG